jgi:tRNA (guanosine-2'-O-)-methyltransferase
MAETRNLGGTELKRLHRDWRRRTDGRLALLLDGVQTPFNVGSILRTAAAYRVDHLWLVAPSASPDHPKTQKTALGSQRFVPWTACDALDPAADQVAAQGYTLIGVELAESARPLHELDLRGDVCLAVGHEDRGLSGAALARCEAVGYVPLLGSIGSLNAAVATAVALYEVRRQAWTA